ncbi:hypothetical protein ES288_D10G176600v1 [Gossypium darwinii]|uniref:ABC transporter domain-containing protein n=1 Tax=Gossypium darwinii TaxID=34276 RepID=A0A5D2AZK0_GOSDA|nr:hypothetical protein ES288_D10G176600v1 [Gossypium darwinii]
MSNCLEILFDLMGDVEIEEVSGGVNRGAEVQQGEEGLGRGRGEGNRMYLVWEELTVALPNFGNGPTRRLLDGVTGCAQPGRIMAIMGPSSSGKSTLLNALASFRLYPSPNLTTTILNIMAAFMSREYKYNRQAFNQKARSMTEKYTKAGAGESSCSYQCTETKVDSMMCAEESRQYGISGVLSYGLLNTIYYLITFLLVW